MCLEVILTLTEEVKARFEEQNPLTFFKVLSITDESGPRLVTPYRHESVEEGVAVAAGVCPPIYERTKIDRGAIHVFLTERDALHDSIRDVTNSVCYTIDVTVPVTCYKEDFIAAGIFADANSATFRKVTYPSLEKYQEEADKAFAELLPEPPKTEGS